MPEPKPNEEDKKRATKKIKTFASCNLFVENVHFQLCRRLLAFLQTPPTTGRIQVHSVFWSILTILTPGGNQVLIAPGHQQQQLESNGIAALDSLKIPKMPQQTIKVGRVEPPRQWLNVNYRDAACALAQQWLRRTAGQPKPRPSKQAAAGAGKGGSSLSCLTFSKYLSRLHNTHLKNTL